MKHFILCSIVFFSVLTASKAQSFQLVKDMYPQTESMLYDYDAGMTFFNGKLYYSSYYGEIVVSDGTADGTSILSKLGMPKMTALSFRKNRFVPMGGKLYYNNRINELCVTDGTGVGTTVVADIHPTDTTSFYGVVAILGASSDKVFFVGNDGTTGFELWVSDGTTVGTRLVRDIVPGIKGFFTSGSLHHIGTVINDKLYFFAKDATNGFEPWVSDGTDSGTFMLINSNTSGDCSFGMASTYGGYNASEMKFFHFKDAVYFSGYNGIYKTDGTTSGTELVVSGSSYGANMLTSMCVYDNKLYFDHLSAGKRLLSKSDGTLEGTTVVGVLPGLMSRGFIELNGELYFRCKSVTNSSDNDYIAKLTNKTQIDSLTRTTAGFYNYHTGIIQPIGNDFLYLGDYYNHAIYCYSKGVNYLVNTTFTSVYDNLLSTPIGTFAIGTNATTGYELWKWEEAVPSGIGSSFTERQLTLYPVPANQVLHILSEEISDIRIVDSAGSLNDQKRLTPGVNRIDVSKLKDGIYFIHRDNGEVEKIIIRSDPR